MRIHSEPYQKSSSSLQGGKNNTFSSDQCALIYKLVHYQEKTYKVDQINIILKARLRMHSKKNIIQIQRF